MKCPTPSGYPMCETCKAAGLSVCAFDEPRLPLVDAEKPKVTVKRLWPVAPNGMTQADLEQLRKAWEGKR